MDWLLAVPMLAWAVIQTWAFTALHWNPDRAGFLYAWQVPEALLAALWLVRAAQRRGSIGISGGRRSTS